jgi:tetratricopeptide (TPR) repeat protein
MRSALISVLTIILGIFAAAAPGLSRADIAAGDRAWAARAEVLVDERIAASGRIADAIGQYREALETDPLSLEARWKLLRALHYAIDFANLDDRAKNRRVEEAVGLARDSLDAADTDRRTDHARVLFWSAIAWGSRAQRVGLLTIVREGVAGQMHHNAQQSLMLDPSVDRGGALRLLSRLHATLPRVPFVSGWVDRDMALPLAERAMAVDPEHPGNRLILALALLEREPDRREEARRLLERVVDSEPRPDFLVEDLAIHEQARDRLESLIEDS